MISSCILHCQPWRGTSPGLSHQVTQVPLGLPSLMPCGQRDDLMTRRWGSLECAQMLAKAEVVSSGYRAGEMTPDQGRAEPVAGRLCQEHRLASKGWQRLLQGHEGSGPVDREAPRPAARIEVCLGWGAGAAAHFRPPPQDEASFFPPFFPFLSLIWQLFTRLFPKQ